MKNPLQKSGFFKTPESTEDLLKTAGRYKGSENAAFMLAVMLTWNLASKIIDDAIVEERKR